MDKKLEEEEGGNEGALHEDDEMAVDEESDPYNDEMAKVFACMHTFHYTCLRRHQAKKGMIDFLELQ